MRGWGAKGLGAAAAAALAAVLAAALWAPIAATALDSDLKHSAALRVKASNGYTILAFVASERLDGRGQMGLIVYDRHGSATYAAPATITASRLEADLGDLGRIALDMAPSGRKATVRECDEDGGTTSFEPPVYRGTFEFHGEEGYTEAADSSPPDFTRFLLRLGCGVSSQGETVGADLPGARLRLHSRSGPLRLSLQANKNRPGARSRFEVEIHEKRGGIAISRSTELWAGAGAFTYDPLLKTATLEPPAPFSGRATFHRGAVVAHRWTGNLAVDLPGRSDVPLAATAVRATLAPSCWHRGEGAFRC
jgi:hypothetical protein